MKIGEITRKPLHMFYYIFLGVLAWYSIMRHVLFAYDMVVTFIAMTPLVPIIVIPLVFLRNRIEIYSDKMSFVTVFKKTSYPLTGMTKVYRRMIAEKHVSGEGAPQRFPYICFEYANGKTISFSFSFLSMAKGTKTLFNQIERLNPEVQFDQDTAIIKSGKDHPKNKLFRFFMFGFGTLIYVVFIFIGL